MSERNYIGGLKKHATRNELVGEAEFWKSRADALAARLEEAERLLKRCCLQLEASNALFQSQLDDEVVDDNNRVEPAVQIEYGEAALNAARAFLEDE